MQNSISLNAVGLMNDSFVMVTSDSDVRLFPRQSLTLQHDFYLEIDNANNRPRSMHQLWTDITFKIDENAKLFSLADKNASMIVFRQPPFKKQNLNLELRVMSFDSNQIKLTGIVNQTQLKPVDMIISAGQQAFGYQIEKTSSNMYNMLPTEHEELVSLNSIK